MARRSIFKLTVEGADMLAKRLDPDHVYGSPIERLLEEGARLGKEQAGKRAPQLSGTLAGSVRSQLHAQVADPYATITAAATSSRGFRYGYALDASPRYHYRGKRRSTRGWFTKIPAIIRRMLNQQVRKAEKEIEAGWKAGGGNVGGGR